MACNYPVRAYRLSSGEVVFDTKHGYDIVGYIKVPCNRCLGCKLEHSRQWAMRCYHEASLYEQNCFITLTYDDDHLPKFGNLHYDHFQKFMKRLRKRFSDRKIRYYMAGEYGSKGNRPHFHACLFNLDFPDKKIFKKTRSGSNLFTSEILDDLWQKKGFCTIGQVTFESAAYVARYMMKKQYGPNSNYAYEEIDDETGEVCYKTREFTRMSLKPGIGLTWFQKYNREVFPNDQCIMNGKAVKPPRYYLRKVKESDGELYDRVIFERGEKARKHLDDQTDDRLMVKEKVLKARASMLKREDV